LSSELRFLGALNLHPCVIDESKARKRGRGFRRGRGQEGDRDLCVLVLVVRTQILQVLFNLALRSHLWTLGPHLDSTADSGTRGGAVDDEHKKE
jgi:hypothetical protein